MRQFRAMRLESRKDHPLALLLLLIFGFAVAELGGEPFPHEGRPIIGVLVLAILGLGYAAIRREVIVLEGRVLKIETNGSSFEVELTGEVAARRDGKQLVVESPHGTLRLRTSLLSRRKLDRLLKEIAKRGAAA